MLTPATRRGYTLFELVIIMAVLIILAVILIPSLSSFRGSTRHKAGADVIRAELATARARAKEEGQPYRVALSQDGTRIRRAPDTPEFAQASAFDQPSGAATSVDYPFDGVTATVTPEGNAPPPQPTDGWVTIASVQPDGTCLEVTTLIAIKEEDGTALYLRIRGVIGSARIVPPPTQGGPPQ